MSYTVFMEKTEELLSKLIKTSRASKTTHYIQTNIAANAAYNFDLKTVIADHAGFDLRSAKVTALLLDDTVGSPTNGYYINSESTLVVGVNAAGLVRVHNHRDSVSTVYITVQHPTVAAP